MYDCELNQRASKRANNILNGIGLLLPVCDAGIASNLLHDELSITATVRSLRLRTTPSADVNKLNALLITPSTELNALLCHKITQLHKRYFISEITSLF